MRLDVDVETITDKECADQLQAIADRHPAEYEALHREIAAPTFCHEHCFLDQTFGWDQPLKRDMEQAAALFWLSGARE